MRCALLWLFLSTISHAAGSTYKWSPPSGLVCNLTAPSDIIARSSFGNFNYTHTDSAACQAWKLAATVCSSKPLPYNGSNGYANWYCHQSTTNCSIDLQYVCTDCYNSCNAGCLFTPMSMRNCNGLEVIQPPPPPPLQLPLPTGLPFYGVQYDYPIANLSHWTMIYNRSFVQIQTLNSDFKCQTPYTLVGALNISVTPPLLYMAAIAPSILLGSNYACSSFTKATTW